MKTKFDLAQITAKETSARLKYSDYQKLFAKEFDRLKAGEKEDCMVITEYEFSDNKKRPLLLFGTTPEWKEYMQSEAKSNKFFGIGECSLTDGKENSLNLTITKGKVSDAAVGKALKKHSPSDALTITMITATLAETEDVEELKGKAGFKLFSKSTFDQIKEKLTAYKSIHIEEYESRLSAINELRDLIDTWLTNHAAPKEEAEKAKRAELIKLRDQLNKAFASIQKKYEDDDNSTGSGSVVNLDPGDKVIDKAAKDISKSRKLGKDAPIKKKDENTEHQKSMENQSHKDPVLAKDVDFSIVGNDAPIVLLAHGSPATDTKYKQVHASHFADKSPKEIVTFLIKKKLPKSYAGVIYIDGCYTAAGSTPQNFCLMVYKMLVKQGYLYLQIKGNLGLAATLSNGVELVTFAQLEKEADKIKKSIEDKEKELKAIEQQFLKDIDLDIKQMEKDRDTLHEAEHKKLLKLFNDPKNSKEEKDRVLKLMLADDFSKANLNIKSLKNDYTKLDSYKNVEKEIKQLNKDLSGIKIEELVGTFGPEKLAPKK